MSSVNTSNDGKRRYHSPLRQAQAEATRERILDAALELFERESYGAATIAELARAAGVSAETIYAQFETKRGVLDGLLARVDRQSVPERARVRSEEIGGGPRGQLGAIVEVVSDFWSDNRALISILRRGTGEQDRPDEWTNRQRLRLRLIEGVVASWPAGTLRAGLDEKRAAELIWVLLSDDVHHLLRDIRQWSKSAYVDRLTEILVTAVLAPPEVGRPRRRARARP